MRLYYDHHSAPEIGEVSVEQLLAENDEHEAFVLNVLNGVMNSGFYDDSDGLHTVCVYFRADAEPPSAYQVLRALTRRPEEVTSADQARDIAICWQQQSSEESPTWGELAEWGTFFEALAEKFPELRGEFEENAII